MAYKITDTLLNGGVVFQNLVITRVLRRSRPVQNPRNHVRTGTSDRYGAETRTSASGTERVYKDPLANF